MQKSILNKKWIVAVSGGPDSMALLDMCRKHQMNIMVAHVNYHKRKSANRDERCVQVYCDQHKIEMKVLHPKKNTNDNFQAWARDVRYHFFFECCDEMNAHGILVAHHQDDVIETYLLQKQRKAIPTVYGIGSRVDFKGYTIVRPLLHLSKKQCIAYCEKHGVVYQTDESNLTDNYARNKVRHHIVEKMSNSDRKAIIDEIKQLNKEKEKQAKIIQHFLKQTRIDCNEFVSVDKEVRHTIIREWLKKSSQSEHKSSLEFIEQLDKVMCSKKNYEIPLGKGVLYKSYQICEIVGNEDKSYSYVLQSIQPMQSPYFKVMRRGDRKDAVTITNKDLPITIRNVNASDKIKLRLGSKSVHRWFIDKKIPLQDRKTWPVVVNSSGEIILVPGIGCNVTHYTIKPSIFVVKY